MPLSTTLCGTMPMTDAKLVEKFFDPYERCVESFDEINESLTGVFQGRIAVGDALPGAVPRTQRGGYTARCTDACTGPPPLPAHPTSGR
jgi:hypothetical protein